ncbi:MAG: helix-turn-helix domain-containing protein [Clostridium sp.]
MRANESIEHIFSELYSIKENRKPGYLKIKVLELLLFLSDLKGEDAFNEMEYLNRNRVYKMRKINDFIIEDIQKHYTIDYLSYKFEISQTNLKKDFQKIYVTSIYAYLKTYRLQVSQRLLLNTNYSIAQIANKIGYENPNKFTFKGNTISGEFTYFCLAPDTPQSTYHIEFRYGSDLDELCKYDQGKYAYWMASGIPVDADEQMAKDAINLFCTENLSNSEK